MDRPGFQQAIFISKQWVSPSPAYAVTVKSPSTSTCLLSLCLAHFAFTFPGSRGLSCEMYVDVNNRRAVSTKVANRSLSKGVVINLAAVLV